MHTKQPLTALRSPLPMHCPTYGEYCLQIDVFSKSFGRAASAPLTIVFAPRPPILVHRQTIRAYLVLSASSACAARQKAGGARGEQAIYARSLHRASASHNFCVRIHRR